MVLNSNILAAFKSILSQSRCSLELKNFLSGSPLPKPPAEGHRVPSDPAALLILAALAFPLIIFTVGSCLK